jgi:hypothetical protein
MTKSNITASLLLMTAAAGLVAYPAFAAIRGGGHNTPADGKKIAAKLDQSKTTLAKAVTAAEQHSNGRAVSVISDVDDAGSVAVHVYCVAGDTSSPKIMKCYFDHATGAVKGMKEVQEFPITPSHGVHGEGRDHPPHGQRDHGNDHGGDLAAKMIKNETLEAACGSCLYNMPGVEGCELAVMIEGKPYLVEGAKWPNHDFCDAKQQAIVTGKLEGGKFIAASLEPKK